MLVFAPPALFTTSSSPAATFASVTSDGLNIGRVSGLPGVNDVGMCKVGNPEVDLLLISIVTLVVFCFFAAEFANTCLDHIYIALSSPKPTSIERKKKCFGLFFLYR